MLKLQAKLVILILLFATSYSAFSRDVTVTPFYGYQFGGQANSHGGEFKIKDSENFGLTVDLPHSPGKTIQLLYIYQNTALQHTDRQTYTTEQLFGLDVQYFHVGGTSAISKGDASAFVSGSIGATYFEPKKSNVSSETLFSVSLGMGVVKKIRQNIALRLQSRLLIPMQHVGGSLFCASGGCSFGVNGGTSILQGDVTAGISVDFN